MFFSVFKNVSGCSGNVFKVSRSNRAGNAIALLLSDSTLIREEKVVSKSEEVIVKLFSLTSYKKFSCLVNIPNSPSDHPRDNEPLSPINILACGAFNNKKPNQKPPERVRLHRINIETGELLVSSIHLDFPNSTAQGLRGLHNTNHTSAYGAN